MSVRYAHCALPPPLWGRVGDGGSSEVVRVRPPPPTPPRRGYGMHTSDSLFIVSGVKSVSHQSHLDRMWQLVMAHRGCLDNPLKESRFLRCVNPLATTRGRDKEEMRQPPDAIALLPQGRGKK